MGLTAKIQTVLDVALVRAGDVGFADNTFTIAHELLLREAADGLDGANRLFVDTRTLAASATEDLDLVGALTDPLAGAFTNAEIVAIYVAAAVGNTNNVLVGNATAAWVGPVGATGVIAVKPGEHFLLTSKTGWPVTATTADMLKIANSAGGTGVTYTVVLIGRSVLA